MSMVQLGDLLADEIAELDDSLTDAGYRAKLPSVRQLQARGLPDKAIETALGVTLRDGDRQIVTLGFPDKLEIRVEWDRPVRPGKDAFDVEGKLDITLGFGASGPPTRPRRWSCKFDPKALLGRLSEAWAPLLLGASYEADALPDARPYALRLEENLVSRSQPQALGIAREGHQLAVKIGLREWAVSFDAALDLFRRLGDLLSYRLLDEKEPIAETRAWLQRETIKPGKIVALAAGMPGDRVVQHIAQLLERSKQEIDLATWRKEPPELVVLARMLPSAMPANEVNGLLDFIDRLPKTSVAGRLEELSREATGVVQDARTSLDFEQGYLLARWLRKALALDPAKEANPSELLKTWGIRIDFHDFAAQVDAIAVWGKAHGPHILVNCRGIHARTSGGLRATLAHELCHILVDRREALPAVEVLGGRVWKRVEVRARAFAAEFLVPRDQAAEVTRLSPSVPMALDRLQDIYGASIQLCAWQIINSGVNLTIPEKKLLQELANPKAFREK